MYCMDTIPDLISFIYGPERGEEVIRDLEELLLTREEEFEVPADYDPHSPGKLPLDESDAFLITYGDQFRCGRREPLECLKRFADTYLKGVIPGIHILPFFPYTSDDGFSVSDYSQVNPDLGTWDHIEAVGGSYKLAVDLVLNHCSVQSDWFTRYLAGEEEYRDYFIGVEQGTDVSMVVRPRALPLLTTFTASDGERLVWTTFSTDQVDLNYMNPRVLIEMIDVLLGYVRRGARMIRLDAIAYLWKEIGHPSIHHPKTHAVVKLFRKVLERCAPWVVILTETNVPHEENISYFGNGDDEAHMVYQFSLPPLVMEACIRGDANHLRSWAGSLPQPEGRTSYFNFLASHDGVGLLPAHGILSPRELDTLVEEVKRRGGLVSYKSTPSGDIPYELNISYRDAVAEPELDDAARVKKFLASQAVMLVMPGVPGIYVHSLLGSGNDYEGVERTGMNRSINRQKLDFDEVAGELDTEGTLRNRIYRGFVRLLEARRGEAAFHPSAGFRVLTAEGGLFAVLRTPTGEDSKDVLCLINVGPRGEAVGLVENGIGAKGFTDCLTGRKIVPRETEGERKIPVEPFEVLWLREDR
jgi:sucrose phosphorylase